MKIIIQNIKLLFLYIFNCSKTQYIICLLIVLHIFNCSLNYYNQGVDVTVFTYFDKKTENSTKYMT